MKNWLFQKTEDEKLMKRWRKGDRKALDLLVNKYHDYVFGVAIHLSKDESLAKDIAQDVFMYLVERKPEKRDIQNLPGFLYVAVKNGVYRHFRDSKNRKQKLIDKPLPRALSTLNDVEYTIEEEFVNFLGANFLPAEEQMILQLTYEGHSTKEIAKICKIGKRYVDTKRCRARKKLRTKKNDLI